MRTTHEARKQQRRVENLLSKQLGAKYVPISDSGSMKVNTPDSMSYDLHAAMDMLISKVGNIDDYVAKKLNYKTLNELYNAFASEQIDALAIAIFNMEWKNESVIIADQTGIGKGRVGAGMIRYATLLGKRPIFFSATNNLFSDMYRDLIAIGSGDLVPFIFNAKADATLIKLSDGTVIYSPPEPAEQKNIIEGDSLPRKYDLAMLTYSQIADEEYDYKKKRFVKEVPKLTFLRKIAEDSILVMDESHKAAGNSNTGNNMKTVLTRAENVLFLSATFAKTADNMALYAQKTAMRETNMSEKNMEVAISTGGVALQEVIASDLVSQGQLIRRERSFEGVEINTIVTEHLKKQQWAKVDSVTEIIRLIIEFQKEYVFPEVEGMDAIVQQENGSAEIRRGTKGAGVDTQPFVSKVFQTIHQLLFAVKTEALIDRAILRLKEDKKVIIAFSSTMGAVVESLLKDDNGLTIGSTVNADFSTVLVKALEGVLRYSIKDDSGKSTKMVFNIKDFSQAGQDTYKFIMNKIRTTSSDIVVSPIDLITKRLQAEGYKVGEVTGRQYKMDLSKQGNKWVGKLGKRKKDSRTNLFNHFNNNKIDVLLINQSGSTGASAHAAPTDMVPASQVKQRAMIIVQSELDINEEMQKLGRIMRTGMIKLPIYDYLNSSIPAEKRLGMMLQKKLKSLDANTTSSQKSSKDIRESVDFLNKYGDKIVVEFLAENERINELLGNPFKLKRNKDGNIDLDKLTIKAGSAHFASGRVAILPCAQQEAFYEEVGRRYNNYVTNLKENDEYDLEVEVLDLKAVRLSKEIIIANTSKGDSPFSDHTYLEKVDVIVLKKPFTKEEARRRMSIMLDGETPTEFSSRLVSEMKATYQSRMTELRESEVDKLAEKIKGIVTEKGYRTKEGEERDAFYEDRVAKITEKSEDYIDRTKAKYLSDYNTLRNFFITLSVGKFIKVPSGDKDMKGMESFGLVEGWTFGSNKRNKYAPSNITLKLMMASSKKAISYDLTYSNRNLIYAIIGASASRANSLEYGLEQYSVASKNASQDRNHRYVFTGNLLQLYGSKLPKGKLIDFTMKDGTQLKGSLLPEGFDEALAGQGEVELSYNIPSNLSLRAINSSSSGLKYSNGMSIRTYRDYGYRISVSRVKHVGGNIFLNPKILRYVVGGNFVSSGGMNMIADITEDNLKKVLNILTDDLAISAEVNKYQFNQIKSEFPAKNVVAKKDLSFMRRNKPKPTTPMGPKIKKEQDEDKISKKDAEAEIDAQRQRIKIMMMLQKMKNTKSRKPALT